MSYADLPLTVQQKGRGAAKLHPVDLVTLEEYPQAHDEMLEPAKPHHIDAGRTGMHPSVVAVIEEVKCRNLNAMDGRDLARCRATEAYLGVQIFTVSQEKAAVYDSSRHLEANFNRPSFVSTVRKNFGLQFDQVILDYYWIPQGWNQSHWSRQFFSTTLADMARHNLLKPATGNNGRIPSGVIYLPFCFHCFRLVLANWDGTLRKYYDLSFLRKDDNLDQIALWAGTRQIDVSEMRKFHFREGGCLLRLSLASPLTVRFTSHCSCASLSTNDHCVSESVLGKQRDQEELYCSFGPKDVKGAAEDDEITKAALVDVARCLEDFSKIRFMALTRIHGNNSRGQIHGLLRPSEVERGYDSQQQGTRLIVAPMAEPVLWQTSEKVEQVRPVTPSSVATETLDNSQKRSSSRKRLAGDQSTSQKAARIQREASRSKDSSSKRQLFE